jgi:hypothetical protein
MVLGPNGMPHYQAQYPSQGDQGQGYEGGAQQAAQYDYGDQGALKE